MKMINHQNRKRPNIQLDNRLKFIYFVFWVCPIPDEHKFKSKMSLYFQSSPNNNSNNTEDHEFLHLSEIQLSLLTSNFQDFIKVF